MQLHGKLIGNPVDVEMFQTTHWTLSQDKKGCLERILPSATGGLAAPAALKGEIRLVRRFEFVHALSSMSVIVQDAANRYHVFVKGSYEVIQKKSLASSHPNNYEQITLAAAKAGCYTLGFAWRDITDLVLQHGESTIHSLQRHEVEKGVQVLGLIMFR
jgi:cation-transporting ATPase 13A3/4/5